MFNILLILLIFQKYYSFAAVLREEGCTIAVNEDFSDPQPLLLYQNEEVEHINAFPTPIDRDGTLNFAQGEKLNVACPGSSVVVRGYDLDSDIVEATCSSGTKFSIEGKTVKFDQITCEKGVKNKARYTGKTCGSNYKEIEIGFEVNGRFIQHVIACFDEELQNTVWTKSVLSAGIIGAQVNYPRPSFKEGKFYNVKPDNVNNLYTRNKQRETINKILGLKKNDHSIIGKDSRFYLARGHYAPKADYIYGAQQKSTFYFVNAAPQWQTFNGGNWQIMEANCRKLAIKKNKNLVIYTGSHGIATLPDVDGEEQKLFLWNTKEKVGIPVPAVYFKVVYEPISKAGIALVGLNNPYKKDVESDVFCEDVCDEVDWLTWKSDDITLGYAYCCKVDDFRKTVKTLPSFEVESLLTD